MRTVRLPAIPTTTTAVLAVLLIAGCAAPGVEEPRLGPSGYAALAECDLETAELLFLRAALDDPADAQSLFALGVAQQGLGKAAFARDAYARALAAGADQPVSADFAPCAQAAPQGAAPIPGTTTIREAATAYLGALPG